MKEIILVEGQIWGNDLLIHRGRGKPLLDEKDIAQIIWEMLHKHQGKKVKIILEEE